MTTHITQYNNYQQYKKIHEKYKQLDPKKRDSFYDKHENEIQLYEDAKKYLDGVINGNKTVPIKAWEKEYAKLTAERFTLCEDYYRLQDEIRYVELLKKGVENLLCEDGRELADTRDKSTDR